MGSKYDENDRPSITLSGQNLRRIKQRMNCLDLYNQQTIIKHLHINSIIIWTFANSCGICCVADTQSPFVAKQKGNGEE